MFGNIKDGFVEQKKFATNYSALSLSIVLLLYYAIIYFHIEIPALTDLFSSTTVQIFLPFYALMGLFSLIGMGLKGGYIFFTRSKLDTPRGLFVRFLIINFIVLIFELCFLSVVIIARAIDRVTFGNYLESSHLFWVCIVSFGLFSVFYFRMRSFGLFKWETLSNLNSLPFVAPAFAFTAPFMFSRSLVVNNIPESLFLVHQALFFGSGLAMLLYLAVFYLTRPLFGEVGERQITILGLKKDKESRGNLVFIMFGLFSVGMYLLVCAVLDIAFYNFIG